MIFQWSPDLKILSDSAYFVSQVCASPLAHWSPRTSHCSQIPSSLLLYTSCSLSHHPTPICNPISRARIVCSIFSNTLLFLLSSHPTPTSTPPEQGSRYDIEVASPMALSCMQYPAGVATSISAHRVVGLPAPTPLVVSFTRCGFGRSTASAVGWHRRRRAIGRCMWYFFLCSFLLLFITK
jgi:hypothetical protein